jgi:hypothetical protein
MIINQDTITEHTRKIIRNASIEKIQKIERHRIISLILGWIILVILSTSVIIMAFNGIRDGGLMFYPLFLFIALMFGHARGNRDTDLMKIALNPKVIDEIRK